MKNIFLILLLAIIAAANVSTALNRGSGSVTVVGKGSVSAKPDSVSMIVTRATVGASAEEAITQGDAVMAKLITVVRSIAGTNVEIKKNFFQVTPQSDGKFVMATAISIKTNNVTTAGNLIKYLYANGASTVSNVSFDMLPGSETEKQANDNALADAKGKAEVMAKSLGKKVGKVMSMADDGGGLSSTISNGAYTGSDIGTISIDKKVSVVYEIQ